MRRAGIIAGAVLAGLLAVVLLLPWWLGLVLRPVGARFGLTFRDYERISYTRFALHGVEVEKAAVRVRVDDVEGTTPLVWAWRHWRENSPVVRAGTWSVDVRAQGGPKAPASADAGWVKLRGQLQRIATQLDRWLPQASLGAGRVTWPGGAIAVGNADWSDRTLRVGDLAWREFVADGTLRFEEGEDMPMRLDLATTNGDGRMTLRSTGASVEGSVHWWKQRGTLQARFGVAGWRPQTAELNARHWRVPGERVQLGQFFAAVNGDARVVWNGSQFDAKMTAHGEPREGRQAPALDVEAHARGDERAITVDRLRANLPGARLQLDQPVVVSRRGELISAPANLSWDVTLEALPWMQARGQVSGHATIARGAEALPHVTFSAEASGVAIGGNVLTSANLAGDLQWPTLHVANLRAALADGSTAEASGAWSFTERTLTGGKLKAAFGSAAVARWLPAGAGFQQARIEANGSGHWPELKHQGDVKVTGVKWPRMRVTSVEAKWQGDATTVHVESARMGAPGGRAEAKGLLSRDGARIDALEIAARDSEPFELKAPAWVRWKPQLQVQGLALTRADAELTVTGKFGEAGAVDVRAREIGSELVGTFVMLPSLAWTVHELGVNAQWNRGPAVFSAHAEVGADLRAHGPVLLTLAARGDARGIALEHINVSQGSRIVAQANGRLPLMITPGAPEWVSAERDSELRFDATTEPDAAFWADLHEATGVELTSPRLAIHAKGTWRAPKGEVSLDTPRVALDAARYPQNWPAIGPVHVRITGDENAVQLERFSVAIEGQRVQAEGSVPLAGNWEKMRTDPLAFFQEKARLRLQIPEAEVAPFVRFAPTLLAAKGRVQADLSLTPGGDVRGTLQLAGLATRPLGGVGVLQDVAAKLRLTGRSVEIESVTGKAGGQTVTISGRVDLPMHEEPRYDLKMKGENLPFVRSMGLLVRGNLDLTLTTPERKPPVIGGKITLRDSLFLSDVRAMIPGGPRGPTQRPPYFAVETEPFRAWGLAVDVRGDKFLRLRTPVFNGTASTRLQLKGTLGSPRLSGEATIDEGAVRLPFAMFSVEQGRVLLEDQPPFEPRLQITATSRRYDYDLRMEVTGTASAPNLTFSSSPPLDSEQILLMVMAGEVPNQAITYSQRQRATRLGAFVGQSLFSTLGGDGGMSDRLTFSSGEHVSRQGRETYSMEYRLNDRWSLTGEYDEFDDYNAGVKWRALREKKPAEKKESEGERDER